MKEVRSRKIRYGVVGLGHIAQVAVLPAFKNAHQNSEIRALISEDEKKLKVLAKKYKVKATYLIDELEQCLQSGEIDVLYVSTPNDKHREIVELAAKYHINVLCEEPMAVTKEDCQHMDQVAKRNNIKLMIAYRLHFEAANLEAMKISREGKLGDLKYFNSSFSYQIKDKNNIRLSDTLHGGGAIYDTGIYCINAARCLFQDEPQEVMAMTAQSGDIRFAKCDETTSVILRFPKERLACFTVSLGAFDSSDYEIIGTSGRLRLENAYEYAKPMRMRVFSPSARGEVKERIKNFKLRDQFSAELIYFSDCVLKNKNPEPNASQGLADIKVIEAIFKSLKYDRPVSLNNVVKLMYPSPRMEISKPGIKKRKAYHATGPNND
ncbi:MAG: Gfo/Idh/MocA family protein [Bacteriovorax sp.]